jgi:hypothetical protein
MSIHFNNWNPGTGKAWACIGSEIDGTSASLTVEEAREVALEIMNRLDSRGCERPGGRHFLRRTASEAVGGQDGR